MANALDPDRQGVPATGAAPRLGGGQRPGGGARIAGSPPRSTTCPAKELGDLDQPIEMRRADLLRPSRRPPRRPSEIVSPRSRTCARSMPGGLSQRHADRVVHRRAAPAQRALQDPGGGPLHRHPDELGPRRRRDPDVGRRRRDAALRHRPSRRSCRSSPARSSPCTRAASRRTTRPTSATPRSYLTYDVLQRRLRDRGHETRCVRNVTDVDDDILRKARELGRALPRSRRRRDGPLRRRHGGARGHRLAAASLGPPRPSPTSAGFIGMVLDRGHAYEAGGAVYFDVGTLRSLRPDQPLRPRRDARPGRRARRQPRRPQQARPARLRAVAALGRRRAVLGVAVGPGSAGLAHRVLGAGPARAGHHHRPARRRQRPDLPPPRVRGRAVRGRHRRAVRAALDAPGHGADGRREDVEVAGQPGVRQRPAARSTTPGPSASACIVAPLPRSMGVGRRH